MAYTQTDLDNIKAAIAEGNLIVQIGDRRVQRRTLDELKAIRAEIEAELGIAVPTGRRGRAWQPVTSSGL